MGNWNELTITPTEGEELYTEGGRSCKFGMHDYIDFVHGLITNQCPKQKCDVHIKDDYSSESFSVDCSTEYIFTCIITGKKYKIYSTKDADFLDSSFWDGFFHWNEDDDSIPVTGLFMVNDREVSLYNGIPLYSNQKDLMNKIINDYATKSGEDNLIRLSEAGNFDLVFELLKCIYK